MNFSLDEEQVAKYKEWRKNHKDCPSDTIGAGTSFIFFPTGLGMIAVVKCSCGETINLTDFDKW